ncbi:MAG TPA: phosphoglycerate mutase family protein [Nannocystaceae bacterium]|nr:phosphoglycerate mutase family protein [Nannocystaceae bacterium]
MRLASTLVIGLFACAPEPTVQPTEPRAAEPVREAAAPTPARTIILVRHGEKQSDDKDAVLSEIGHARARCLAQTLGDAAITHAFTTEFKRTQETLAPLVAKHELTPTAIPAEQRPDLVAALRALPPAAIAVVAGHSNTVPDVLVDLGGERVAFGHDDYDWLFIVSLPAEGPATFLRTHYCVTPASR